MKVCVLASGGYDSGALIADLRSRGRRVYPLFVRCGLYWEKAELHWLRRFLRALPRRRLEPLSIIDATAPALPAGHWSRTGRGVPPEGSPMDSVFIPGRNLVLLSAAGAFCSRHGIGEIAMATLKGNPFPDASAAFRAAMARSIGLAIARPMKISAPYWRLDKVQVRRRASGFPASLTFSCIRPDGVLPCGKCSKCEERNLLKK